MPIYEYRCSNGHQYERAEGFDAPVEQVCQICGGGSRRVISAPAVIFKGPGFYSTDNRKGYAGGNGGSSSRSDGSSESKPEESKPGESKAEPAAAE